MSLMETMKQQLLQLQLHHGSKGIESSKPFQKLLRLLRKNHQSSCPRVLDLSGVELLSHSSFKLLCDALGKCHVVQALMFSACELDDDAGLMLAKLLSDPNKVIFEVDVSFNQLTNRSVSKIFEAIKLNSFITIVQLLANDCTPSLENELQSFLTRRKLEGSPSSRPTSVAISTATATTTSTPSSASVSNAHPHQHSWMSLASTSNSSSSPSPSSSSFSMMIPSSSSSPSLSPSPASFSSLSSSSSTSTPITIPTLIQKKQQQQLHLQQQEQDDALFGEDQNDEVTKRNTAIAEAFFKGLNHILQLCQSSKCTKKDLYKLFSELITNTTRDLQHSSSFTASSIWEELFHLYFLSSSEIVPITTMESYEKLVREFLSELHIRIQEEEGNKKNLSSAISSFAANNNYNNYNSSTSSHLNSSPGSFSFNSLLGVDYSSASSNSSSTCSSNSSSASSSPIFERHSTGSSSTFLGLSFVNNTNTRIQRLNRLMNQTQEFLQFILLHKVDAVNSLIGMVPAFSIASRHFGELQKASIAFERRQSRKMMKRKRTFSVRYNLSNIGLALGNEQSKGGTESESGSRIEGGGDTATEDVNTMSDGTEASSLSTSPCSFPASPLSTSPLSTSPPTFAKDYISAVPQHTLASKIAVTSTGKITKGELEKRILDWSDSKEEDGVIIRQIQELAAQIRGCKLTSLEAGDLIVVRTGSVLVYGRVTRVISPGSLMIRTSLTEAASTYSRSDTAPFPQALLPLLQSFSSAKRLVENSVDSFYRDMVARVRDCILNHLAFKGVDVVVFERAVQKQVLLSDEAAILKMIDQLQRVLDEGLDGVVEKLEVYLALGLHELRDTMSNNPLLRDAMRMTSEFNVRMVVWKRVQDHYSKLGEALEAVRTERTTLMDGKKRLQLSSWWLKVIQEKVHSFLTERNYEQSALPEDFLNEPPRSLRKLRKNLAIVKRWLKPSSEDEIKSIRQLVKSISNQIQPRLDRFILNSEFLILEFLANANVTTPKAPYIMPPGEPFNQSRMEEVKLLANQAQERVPSVSWKQVKSLLSECEYVGELKVELAEPTQAQNESPVLKKGIMTDLVIACLTRMESDLSMALEYWSKEGRLEEERERRKLLEEAKRTKLGVSKDSTDTSSPDEQQNDRGRKKGPYNRKKRKKEREKEKEKRKSDTSSETYSISSKNPSTPPIPPVPIPSLQTSTEALFNTSPGTTSPGATQRRNSVGGYTSSSASNYSSNHAKISQFFGEGPPPGFDKGLSPSLSSLIPKDKSSTVSITPSAPPEKEKSKLAQFFGAEPPTSIPLSESSSPQVQLELPLILSTSNSSSPSVSPSPSPSPSPLSSPHPNAVSKKDKLSQFFGTEPSAFALEVDPKKEKLTNFFGVESATQTNPPSSAPQKKDKLAQFFGAEPLVMAAASSDSEGRKEKLANFFGVPESNPLRNSGGGSLVAPRPQSATLTSPILDVAYDPEKRERSKSSGTTNITSGATTPKTGFGTETPHLQLCWKLKMIVLGGEKTGKTSLLKALMNGYSRNSGRVNRKKEREGSRFIDERGRLDVHKWDEIPANKDANFEFTCLDFNGSLEVTKAIHPLFLSQRCVYLLAFDLRDGTDGIEHLDFWLQSLESQKNKRPPPAIIVGTHLDDKKCTDEYVAQVIATIEQRFMQRFPNIVALTAVSSTSKKGIDFLRKEIENAAREIPNILIPTSYLDLVRALQEEEKNSVVISWSRLKEIWKLISPGPYPKLTSVVKILTDIGSLVHFNDSASPSASTGTSTTSELYNMIVVNITGFVSMWMELLRGNHDFIDRGLVKRSDWALAWTTASPDVISYMVALMKRFEILLPLPSKRGEPERLLIPALLPKEPPQDINNIWPPYAFALPQYLRTYKFEYLPNGLFSRLLLRLLHYSYAIAYWYSGVVVTTTRESALMEVRAMIKVTKNELQIFVRGDDVDGTASFMRTIVEMLDLLLQCWFDVKHEVFIPCPHCIQLDSNTPAKTIFSLQTCDKNAAQGNTIFYCGNRQITLDSLAPDVAMTDFNGQKLDLSSVKIETVLLSTKWRKLSKGIWNNELVASKEFLLSPDRTPVSVFKEFRREVWTMSALQHPNIVKLLGFSPHPMGVVMEFIPHGDLYGYLKNENPEWPMRLRIALDIAQGMTFLHSSTPPLLHRDLKTPNIFMVSLFVNAPVVCKVGDFGMSSRLYIDELQETTQRAVDNPTWLAPEVLKGDPYTEKSDVYAFGIMLWELISKARPFSSFRFFYEIEDFVNSGGRPTIPKGLDAEYAELIRNAWHDNIHQRPTFEECLFILLKLKDKLAPSLCTPIFSKYPEGSLHIKKHLNKEPIASLLTGEFQKNVALPTTRAHVNCLLWIGTHVWAGTADGTIIIWNSDGTLIARYQAHWEPILQMVVIEKKVWTLSSYQVCSWQSNLVENLNQKGVDTRRSMTKEGSSSFFSFVEKTSSKDRSKRKKRYLSLAAGTLYTYVQKSDTLPENFYPIEQGTTIEKDKSIEGSFSIRQPDGKRIHFIASKLDQAVWISCLRETISQVCGYTDLRLKCLARYNSSVPVTCMSKLGTCLCVSMSGGHIQTFKLNGKVDTITVQFGDEHNMDDSEDFEEAGNDEEGEELSQRRRTTTITSLLECKGALWAAVGKFIYRLHRKSLQPTEVVLRGHTKTVALLTRVEGSIWSYALDHTIKLWNLETQECLQTLSCSSSPSIPALSSLTATSGASSPPSSLAGLASLPVQSSPSLSPSSSSSSLYGFSQPGMVAGIVQSGRKVWVAQKNGRLSTWDLDSFKQEKLNTGVKSLQSLILVWDKEIWMASESSVSIWY